MLKTLKKKDIGKSSNLYILCFEIFNISLQHVAGSIWDVSLLKTFNIFQQKNFTVKFSNNSILWQATQILIPIFKRINSNKKNLLFLQISSFQAANFYLPVILFTFFTQTKRFKTPTNLKCILNKNFYIFSLFLFAFKCLNIKVAALLKKALKVYLWWDNLPLNILWLSLTSLFFDVNIF